jgi:hypothetical protein
VNGLLARTLLLVAGVSTWSCGTPLQVASEFTSIRADDCVAPPDEVTAAYKARGLEVQRCPAPDGWQLLLVSSDANTWIDLGTSGLTWSGERPTVYESPLGNFPSVDSSPGIEWRRNNRGQLTALIYRVTAQDRETLETDRSMFYVVRLRPDAACVIGRADSSEEARTLADGTTGCG